MAANGKSALEAYFRKHGHYPTLRLRNGSVQTIEVQVAPGYIRISTQPHGATIYIPRRTWFKVLRWVITPSKHMTHSWDVEAAMHHYLEQEQEFTDELRRQKRQRRGRRRKGAW
jgi:hypothetical protein